MALIEFFIANFEAIFWVSVVVAGGMIFFLIRWGEKVLTKLIFPLCQKWWGVVFSLILLLVFTAAISVSLMGFFWLLSFV